jgi:prepilin-type N-terminal cleavage/methylation domain-containing protein
MNTKSVKKAFSLIELSVAIIIIGVLVAGVVSGKRLIAQSKLTSAQAITKNSVIFSIPDLALWLEPVLDGSITGVINGNNLSNNELVSSWNDISSNQINVTQATGGNQPTYKTIGINSLPTLNFDGNSDYLFSTTKVPVSEGDDSFTFVAVWNRTDPASGSFRSVFEQNTNGASTAGRRASMLTSSSTRYGFNGESNDFHNNSYGGSSTIAIITVTTSGAVKVYTNSNAVSASGSINATTENISRGIFIVGAKGLSTKVEFFYGNISEIMVFDRNLKPSEINLINNYLSKKYNITVS